MILCKCCLCCVCVRVEFKGKLCLLHLSHWVRGCFEGSVHLKIKVVPSFTHPRVVPNAHTVLSLVEHKTKCTFSFHKSATGLAQHDDVMHLFCVFSDKCVRTVTRSHRGQVSSWHVAPSLCLFSTQAPQSSRSILRESCLWRASCLNCA